jgi:hypothetical protein
MQVAAGFRLCQSPSGPINAGASSGPQLVDTARWDSRFFYLANRSTSALTLTFRSHLSLAKSTNPLGVGWDRSVSDRTLGMRSVKDYMDKNGYAIVA